MMGTQPHQRSESGSESSQLMGASSNTSLIGTQAECRQLLVHCNAANAATRNTTQDAHSTIIDKAGSRKNKKNHAVGCD